MKYPRVVSLALMTMMAAGAANADPIEIVRLAAGDYPQQLGGYELTPFAEPTGSSQCTPSPAGGEACFFDHWGNSVELSAEAATWWQFPQHGNIFVVREHNWIDLVLPESTRAFSLFVGASAPGHAWIQAYNTDGHHTAPVHFAVNRNVTRGYGMYATGCSAISRVTIEPWEWGFGYLAAYQGPCRAVSEPGPVPLLVVGLAAIALQRRTGPGLRRVPALR